MVSVRFVVSHLLIAALSSVQIECKNSFSDWQSAHWRRLKDIHWRHSISSMRSREGADVSTILAERSHKKDGFELITYLPHTDSNTFCKGIIRAISENEKLHSVNAIHLFRHENSCIHTADLPVSQKIIVHEIEDGKNMTFAELMKFIVSECWGKNILLARANMFFRKDINLYLKDSIENGVVHVLKSVHPLSTTKYDGTHFAFVFKGQWDKTESTFDTVGLEFELDSPNLDNENVMMKAFEVSLKMTLKGSSIHAYPICLH